MARFSELLIIQPSISDIDTILRGRRPEVEPVRLDAERPAARQIAEARAGRRDLEAVHVIAHGAPGVFNARGCSAYPAPSISDAAAVISLRFFTDARAPAADRFLPTLHTPGAQAMRAFGATSHRSSGCADEA